MKLLLRRNSKKYVTKCWAMNKIYLSSTSSLNFNILIRNKKSTIKNIRSKILIKLFFIDLDDSIHAFNSFNDISFYIDLSSQSLLRFFLTFPFSIYKYAPRWSIILLIDLKSLSFIYFHTILLTCRERDFFLFFFC